jgi:hypothetical protein
MGVTYFLLKSKLLKFLKNSQLGIRGCRFLIYNFLQFAIDGKNKSKTNIEKVFGSNFWTEL